MVLISVYLHLLISLLVIITISQDPMTQSFTGLSIGVGATCEEPTRELDSEFHARKSNSEHCLVTVLISQSLEQRETIRNTWKRYSNAPNSGSLVIFVVGTKGISPTAFNDLAAEQAKHKDVILLQDVSDKSQNTEKVFHTFRWLDKNLNFSYGLISNDYCFIRLDKLTQELNQRTNKVGLYWGYFVGSAVPQKSGPWAEKRWFLCDRYSPYALSGGYILSSNIIHKVMLNSDLIQLYSNEDVSVGVWTSAFNIERKHDIRFDVEAASRGCKNDFRIICAQSADNIRKIYDRLEKGMPLCEIEGVRREYVYNWTAKPSQCCENIVQ